MRKLRIAQVSKADAHGGGASRVAEILADGARRHGLISHHWASWAGKGFDDEQVFSLYGKRDSLVRNAHTVVKRIGFPELMPFELIPMARSGMLKNYDLFHFHDISSAISPLTLRFIARSLPVVWTIHDCSPFTGGCLYPMGCERFKQGCGSCPQLGIWPVDTVVDGTRVGRRSKEVLHQKGDVVSITPSRWMSDLAYSSGMFQQKPIVVPNGIDERVFFPTDKIEARRKIGIPSNRRVILMSAGNLLDERKGTRFALEAIEAVRDLDPFLLLVGSLSEEDVRLFEKYDYHHAGYIDSPEKMALVYSAGDIFLFCSLADNHPLSVLETMSVGTPTVGFATGGIPEIVIQDFNGYLVPPRNLSALIAGLRRAFDSNLHLIWAKNGRDTVEKSFTSERMTRKHLELYQSFFDSDQRDS